MRLLVQTAIQPAMSSRRGMVGLLKGALRHLLKTRGQCAWSPWLSLSLKYAKVE